MSLEAIRQFAIQIQPLIIVLSAVLGTIFAGLGLKTWQRQLKGRTEYELARRYLRATLSLRNEIQALRSPFVFGGEIQAAAKRAGLEDPSGVDQKAAVAAARAARWRAVQEASTTLRLEELEAEVIWGSSVAAVTGDLRALLNEIWSAEAEYSDRTSTDYRDESDRERLPTLRRKMYGNADDEVGEGISAAVSKVEDAMRPHLKR